ncbi:MAG: transcription antitermination factor NusB [bacterium]|nr:transcription antitermination factor NusB [bacterium]MDD5756846.1 transcription antitermination factor NusB [bacterium]
MGSRRKAREIALQMIYSIDVSKSDIKDSLNLYWEHNPDEHEVVAFANMLSTGTMENLAKIDELITQYTKNWNLKRMASVDRNILRVAIYELVFYKETPVNVVINEAVELAKKYSTNESGGFVNGILDKVKEVRNDNNGQPPADKKRD